MVVIPTTAHSSCQLLADTVADLRYVQSFIASRPADTELNSKGLSTGRLLRYKEPECPLIISLLYTNNEPKAFTCKS